MEPFQHISGLIAAPHTPFSNDGEVDFTMLPKQIEALSRQGLAGVFVNGTTGEGLSLTRPERERILASWTETAPSSLKVIAHVGHHSAREAAALARHASDSGAYGISTMGPSFLKPGNARALVDFCKPIAAAAPDLAFYYYHIPSLSGVCVPMVEFLELGGKEIPNLAGIKYTHGDLFEFQRCRALQDGRFDLLWGVDEVLLGALAVGATGAVGSTYNYAAPIYHRMMEAFATGDLETARDCSMQSVRLIELLIKFGVLPSGKALMSLHGADCGPPRPPVCPLSPEKRAEMLAAVTALGVIHTPDPVSA